MNHQALVWIDQNECMGAGTREQIAPDVFMPIGDGLWGVAESAQFFAAPVVFSGKSGPGEGPAGYQAQARVPGDLMESVVDAVEECPGECIYMGPAN